MTIEICCPGCKRKIAFPDNAAGKRVRCLGCSAIFTVPSVVLPGSSSSPARIDLGGLDALADGPRIEQQAQIPVPAPQTRMVPRRQESPWVSKACKIGIIVLAIVAAVGGGIILLPRVIKNTKLSEIAATVVDPAARQLAESRHRLHTISKGLWIYSAASNDMLPFPPSWANLVHNGNIRMDDLKSPGEPSSQYILCTNLTSESPGNSIFVYDPAKYNNLVPALLVSGRIVDIPAEKLQERLQPRPLAPIVSDGASFSGPPGWIQLAPDKPKTKGWFIDPDSKPADPDTMIMIEIGPPADRDLNAVANRMARDWGGSVRDDPLLLDGAPARRVTVLSRSKSLAPVEGIACIRNGKLYLIMGGVKSEMEISAEVEYVRAHWKWVSR